MLRRTVPKGHMEQFLSGTLPHEIQFQNHCLVYEHLPFVIKAVQSLVITRTPHLYGPEDGKPKVVNPLSVALNANKERLVLNGISINLFMKTFRLDTKDSGTFLPSCKRPASFRPGT